MTSALPATSVVLQTENQRAGSIRSVASNSSIASGVSLSRRPRIRTRAKTLTTGAFDARARADAFAIVGDRLFLGSLLVDESTVDGAAHRGDNAFFPASSAGILPPQRPPRSPQRPEAAPTDLVSADGHMDAQPGVFPLDPDAQQNPQHEYDNIIAQYNLAGDSSATPSTDNHDSFPVSARPFANIRIRDSIVTHKSASSSSVYPPSTSTTSGTDSASPHSVLDLPDHYDDAIIESDTDEAQEFDGDDVSYRLRLLMKNNYFLPPAHSKPSLSDLAQAGANGVKKPTRQMTPTFLDLFRMGRSKPRPQPLNNPPDVGGPVLRTTSDQNSLSGAQTRLSPTTPLSPSRQIPVSPNRAGRVVVVREKMNDLAGAAKQAEQEMKTRSARREQGSLRGQKDITTVIDPTDAVDLPPPAAGYPFPVQASALHGLGVEDSVGAAVLAEHLPPPNSPGMSMLSPEEYAWRKALLREAVGHSLQNSPAVSTTSPSPVVTTSMDSSRLTDSGTPSRAVSMKRVLGQRIIAQPLIEESPTPSPRVRATKGRRERGLGSPNPHEAGRGQSYLPRRAETPAAAPFPLAPPPRRQIFNPLYSLSQTDLTRPLESRTSTSSRDALRRTVSSPRLSDAYESDVRALVMTPPPVPHSNAYGSVHSRFDSSFEANRALASQATTTDSHYSEEDHAPPRDSTTLSIPTIDRPSLSDYSQPSPTASAFQDALDYPYYYSSPNPQTTPTQNNRPVTPRTSDISPANRYTSMSPPPRVSSSLANVVLSPPPRSTSLSRNQLITRSSTSTGRSPSSDLGHFPVQPAITRNLTSPFSAIEHRGQNIPLSLQIPNYNIPLTVRSAPPPASPIAFFDDIQAQPNAMDDLDSSSDEDGDDGRHTPIFSQGMRTRSTSNLSLMSSKPLAMRMGNHSSPHVARSYECGPLLPIGPTSPTRTSISKLPIGNVASPAPFFKYSKSDQGHGPVTAFDLHRLTQQSASTSETRPLRLSMSSTQGVPIARAWQTDQKVRRDSVRKLDGMLIRHMETERDTIKRIASSARQLKV